MRGNEISLHLGEAISNKDVYLICYVRFIDNDDNIVQDVLFYKSILISCKAHELFVIPNDFLKQIILSGNIVLAYVLTIPVLFPVVSVGYER